MTANKKRKKPSFKRQGTQYGKIKDNWRKPRGRNSKQQKGWRGTPKKPNIGYRQPKEIRGLHPSGYKDILIHSPKEIEELNPEEDAVRIASSVGKKKRSQIIEKAEEKGLKILNK